MSDMVKNGMLDKLREKKISPMVIGDERLSRRQ
jgi:hypothetical protein